MTDFVTIEIECPDAGVAAAIAEALVARRLVACANIHAPVESVYRWQGGIERAHEVPLVLKTRAALVPAVAAEVIRLHPYETPAILARPAAPATDAARAWLLAETDGADAS